MDHRQFASMGGKARAKKLSKKRRIEIAKKAVQTREAKRKPKLGDPDYSSSHSIDVNGHCNMGCC
jgi:hypothetical protein